MNKPYRNKLYQIQKERRELKDRIKKEFVDTGQADNMINMINEKRKDSTDIQNLPF